MIRYVISYLMVIVVALSASAVPAWSKPESQTLAPDTPATEQNYQGINLGLTYLPITDTVSRYYELGVSSGALVTEVTEDGMLDEAGIKAGDVIVSFNGISIGEDTPLLGIIRGCHPGDPVVLEIWDSEEFKTIEMNNSPN